MSRLKRKPTPGYKYCYRCKQELECEHFHKNCRSADGYQDFCINCQKEYAINYYENNPDKLEKRKESKRRWHRNRSETRKSIERELKTIKSGSSFIK